MEKLPDLDQTVSADRATLRQMLAEMLAELQRTNEKAGAVLDDLRARVDRKSSPSGLTPWKSR